MSKKSKKGTEVTPRDIAKALDGISAWVRSVRSTVAKMDKKATVTVPRPRPTAAAPLPMLDGCPPPLRPKKRKK